MKMSIVSCRVAAAVGLTVAVLAVGVAAAASAPTDSVRCPRLAPSLVAPGPPAAATLVRPEARSLLLCRYLGLNPKTTALRLRSSRLLTSRMEVRTIAALLNGLPPLGTGIHCPMDDGSEITATFAYATGAKVIVRVGLTGCRTVTGRYLPVRTAISPAGQRLVARLERLVP
jgi:hypothetical protein